MQKKIGPAWTSRGRPADGYFTKRTAEAWLRDVLDQVLGLAALHDLERERLVQKSARGVVVIDREPCAGNAFVPWPRIERRDRWRIGGRE